MLCFRSSVVMWVNWQLYIQQIYIRFHVYCLFKKTPQSFTFCWLKLRKYVTNRWFLVGFNKLTRFVIHVECRIKAVECKYLLIYMLILHPPLFFVSAQIQIVNSNSKLYIVYTLYIIRDTGICDCLLRNGQSVGVKRLCCCG